MMKKGIIPFFCVLFLGAVVLNLSTGLKADAGEPLSTSMDPAELSSFVGSLGIYSGIIQGNWLEEFNTERATEILGSGNGNSGIVSVNQASGNLNNQVNLRVLALVTDPTSVFELLVLGQFDDVLDNQIHSFGASSSDLIAHSFHGSAGILGINQASGSLNIQSNILTVVIGGTAFLTDLELSYVRATDNTLIQEETGSRFDMIKDSFADTNGIVQVNQSAGDMNVLGNNLALSYREINLK